MSRRFRLGLFGVFLVLVCFALGFRILTTASIKGVVNAPILLIQSPIDGRVTMIGLKAGKTVDEGEVLFRIENQRLDTGNLERIRSEIEQVKATADSLRMLITQYAEKLAALEGRLKDYLEASRNNLSEKLRTATQEQTKAAEAEAQAMRDLPRAATLAEKAANARTRWTQARNERNAWRSAVESDTAELAANEQGISRAGYSETPYAHQRMDELDMRLAETKAKLEQEEKRQVALQKELQAEEAKASNLLAATIVAPSLSLVQSVRVAKGSDVIKGTVLCELVDAANSYVEASIPERDFDNVRLGQKATVYLYGSDKSVPGVVISVRGAGVNNASNPEESAAMLARTTPDSMIVNVSINADDLKRTFGSANQVGRTARIVLSKD